MANKISLTAFLVIAILPIESAMNGKLFTATTKAGIKKIMDFSDGLKVNGLIKPYFFAKITRTIATASLIAELENK